jgi:hypothetical protein|tara:strand:- start:4918 stop:5682 length:765 start_codon:yes stop_codon:yes gene_type:complete
MSRQNTLVICPKGTLHNRVKILISAMIFAEENGLELCMIWDHPVEYSSLFVDTVKCIEVGYLKNKSYYYNPALPTCDLIKKIKIDNFENVGYYFVLETGDEFYDVSAFVSHEQYRIERMCNYQRFIRDSLSGNITGKLNYTGECVVFDKTRTVNCIGKNQIFPQEDGGMGEHDMYANIISLSNSRIIICYDDTLHNTLLDSLDIVPLIVLCKKQHKCDKSIATTTGFMEFGTVLNPDIKAMIEYIKSPFNINEQ